MSPSQPQLFRLFLLALVTLWGCAEPLDDLHTMGADTLSSSHSKIKPLDLSQFKSGTTLGVTAYRSFYMSVFAWHAYDKSYATHKGLANHYLGGGQGKKTVGVDYYNTGSFQVVVWSAPDGYGENGTERNVFVLVRGTVIDTDGVSPITALKRTFTNLFADVNYSGIPFNNIRGWNKEGAFVGARVHQGFAMAANKLLSTKAAGSTNPLTPGASKPGSQLGAVLTHLCKKGQRLWFTGHSLGGSVAQLLAAQVADNTNAPRSVGKGCVKGVYAFGNPRPSAGVAFNDWFDKRIPAFNFSFSTDLVPHLPPQNNPMLVGFVSQLNIVLKHVIGLQLPEELDFHSPGKHIFIHDEDFNGRTERHATCFAVAQEKGKEHQKKFERLKATLRHGAENMMKLPEVFSKLIGRHNIRHYVYSLNSHARGYEYC